MSFRKYLVAKFICTALPCTGWCELISPTTLIRMICHRCLYRLQVSHISVTRFASTTATIAKPSTSSAPRETPRGSHDAAPTATSTSAAQPFSTPQSSSIPTLSSSAICELETIVSSVPAGTPLKGLGYFKGKDPPLAKEVHEYPSWLWGLLNKAKEGKNEAGDDLGDSYCKLLPRPSCSMSYRNNAGCITPNLGNALFLSANAHEYATGKYFS